MKKSVSLLPAMALSVAFLAACTDDSSNGNPATPEQTSSSSEMLLPASSDVAPGSSSGIATEASSSSVDAYQPIDPSAITLDENGFAEMQAVYRSLQANEKVVFAVRHAERDQFVTRQGELTEDDIEAVKHYVINPVETREASLESVDTLKVDYPEPDPVEVIEGFNELDEEGLAVARHRGANRRPSRRAAHSYQAINP